MKTERLIRLVLIGSLVGAGAAISTCAVGGAIVPLNIAIAFGLFSVVMIAIFVPIDLLITLGFFEGDDGRV